VNAVAPSTSPPTPRTRAQAWIDRIGIHPPLFWGFLGVLLFMIGDGVESGYLAPYLRDNGISDGRVALVFSVYGVTAAIAAWSSGALSDLWGPRRVMVVGLAIWVGFEFALLLLGLPGPSYEMVLLSYGLRGFGYPLFAFGFLVWITAATPQHRLGTGVGWFWFAFTAGLPTVGSYVASGTIPLIGQYATFWLSLGLVALGGLVALVGLRERTGFGPLAPVGQRPLSTLLASLTILWQRPRIGAGCAVRTINTAAQYGFLVALPGFFTDQIGFSLERWLQLLGFMFASNIVWNLIFGVIGDHIGWRRTVIWCGGIGCAVSTLLLYYVPLATESYLLSSLVGALYGATLAGYVPLSALMPSMVPEQRGGAMAALNLGAGASAFVGPAVVGLVLGPWGVQGVMWVFSAMYVVSAGLATVLTLPAAPTETPAEHAPELAQASSPT
jgi:polyol permease family